MVNYICYRCGWSINHKTKMINHIARKYSCKNKLNNINLDVCKDSILFGKSYDEYLNDLKSSQNVVKYVSKVSNFSSKKSEKSENNKKYKCNYCEKEYVHNQSLYKHNKKCKEKIKEEEVKDSMDKLVKILNKQLKEQNNQLKKKDNQIKYQLKEKNNQLKEKDNQLKKELYKRDKQIKEQNKRIEELIKKAGINNSNITQNIQNNIKLLAYKDTDISTITNKDIRSCMNHNNMCVPHLIKMIHLDPKKPENHNVYISNLKNGYIMVYDGDKWDTLNREEIIEDMINNKECLIQDRVEDWLENGKNYPIIMRKFERYLEKKEKDVVLNKIKEEIRLMLFNNRNMININLRKLLLDTEEQIKI